MEAAALNERIRRLFLLHRTRVGYTIEKMARLMDMTPLDYRSIEGGTQADIDTELVNVFCKALNLPIHRFLLEGACAGPDYAMLISEQWSLICQMRQYQRQLDELIVHLQETQKTSG